MASWVTFVYLASFTACVVAATSLAIAMPPQPAKQWLVASAALTGLWALADAFSNLAESPWRMEAFAHGFAFSWSFLPWTWLRATALYAGARPPWGARAGALASSLPAFGCLALSMTNRLHSAWTPAQPGGFFHVQQTPWIFAVGAYFLAYSALCALLLAAARRREGSRELWSANRTLFLGFMPAAIVLGTVFNGVLGMAGVDLPLLGSVVAAFAIVTSSAVILRRGFFAPIGELKRWAEDSLRAAEARYRTLLETSPDGILLVAPDGELLAASPAACRMWGHPSAEGLLSERRSLAGLLVAEDREVVGRALGTARRDAPSRAVVARGLRADQSVFPLELSVGVLAEGAAEEAGFVCAARDVSERTRAERERQALREQVLHAQKAETLGALARGIAHDFNNLLVGVLGNASLALRYLAADAEARPFVETVEQAASSGALLTRQLLTFTGRKDASPQAVDLSACAAEMARLLSVSVPRAVRVELALESGLPPVAADPGQLQQVAMNLFVNAAEAIGEQGGRIRVATSAMAVGSDLVDHEGAPVVPSAYGVLEVSDTGCGIAPEARGRLFDPFFSTKAKGRGLGLAAVLGIVRSHGGAILLDSAQGRGTTFRGLWPLAGPELAAAAGAGAAAPKAGEHRFAGEAVLVADDEALVRSVIESTLTRAGLKPLAVRNGQEAVDLFERSGVAVAAAILDVDMPVLDGRGAARRLRELRPALPIVYVTGHATAETLEALRRTEAAVVPKPFTPQGLLDCLSETMRRAGAGRA